MAASMPLVELFLSRRGRLARGAFWLAGAALLAAFLVLLVFVESVAGRRATLLLYPPLYWGLFALASKRLHDVARSAAWLLVALVPVLGGLWLALELGLRRGTDGDNQYGPDPLTAGRDYLTVR
jgi:uncharacterized membrane protein YhaH (DUF805 family)